MSAFTFTAPIVTEEEERQERAALSEAERNRYDAEVYGTEELIVETETMLTDGLTRMTAILATLPNQEDYQEALRRVPELVERESSAAAFLRSTRYDPQAAAMKLVDYWSIRRKVFQDRAFLPMTMNGAMEEDMEYLNKAIVVILANDKHLRPVVFTDRIRCTKEVAPRDSVVRCFFYGLQTLAEQQNVQRKGYVYIENYRVSAMIRNWGIRKEPLALDSSI